MSDDGPRIYRPVPRRPFELGPLEQTSSSSRANDRYHSEQTSASSPSFLDSNPSRASGDSISRNASYRALTESTLSGIYSPGFSGQSAWNTEEAVEDDTIPPPVRKGTVDEQMYLLMRGRQNSLLIRRRSSVVSNRFGQSNQGTLFWALGLRTTLLYALGMGYGALLSRLSTEQNWAPFHVDGMRKTSYDGRYLAAWGLFGVVLGSLLPWFDAKWEKIVEKGTYEEEPVLDGNDNPGTDWALVIRGIGAFAGIVFAIVGSLFQKHEADLAVKLIIM